MTILEKANAVLAEKETKLLPENIKSGLQVFEITGTLVSLKEGSADATAVAEDLKNGKTAYVNGEKIVGTAYEVPTSTEVTQFATNSENIIDLTTQIKIIADPVEMNVHVAQGAKLSITLNNEILAAGLGITADKIKSGETILGITGTYTGE